MGRLNKEIILLRLSEHKGRIRSFGVKHIALFGSYAHDMQKQQSDLDFLVEFGEGRGLFDDYFGLLEFLQELFGTENIDLVKKHLVRDELKKEILEGKQYAAQI